MKTLNILIIASSDQEKLVQTCRNRGHNPILKKPTDLSLYVSDNPKGFDSVYDDENGGKLKIKDIDAVITRIGANAAYGRAVVEHLQRNLGIFCVQSAEAMRTASDKFLSAQKFSQNGIKVPKQWYAHSPKSAKHMIDKLGKLPVILKEQTGSSGAGIILLESSLQTNMTLQAYYHKDIRLILQEFIDNGGKDERHIVVDDKICCSMERQAPKHDIRANVSLEGTAKSIEADNETKEVVLDMVKSIPNLNFAGCDVIKRKNDDGSQTIFALEINSNPGSKIIDVTGHNYFEDLLDYVEANYKKGGNGGSAQSYATSLSNQAQPATPKSNLDVVNDYIKDNPDDISGAIQRINTLPR
jgi:ribosomal protein S6--L-glutamate ligase